ncbi:nitrate/nitrite transporter [Lacimicrobium alkaliphilum]|uniref:MFS transporter n=1 Tax=Lacimicrobium alkaliphilum TaxID=1526571 RepID=A0A0U2PFD8_9ALTE|nr:MFS transporter [Lacimicrobium alkaliphilum]ALS98029.1 MFS transporter [Lacimicrobium alkaliphilum]
MIEAGSVAPADQRRALGLSTFAFTLCFAVWTIFSILGIQLKQELGLSDTELGLLMATPILTGSISRLFLGVLTDRFGGRWVFGLLMLLTAAAVFLVSIATSYILLLIAALGVGLAGGGFIVGVAYISAWYEKDKQGTALGIFGAGNVGAALTNFGAPFLMLALGWQGTAQIYALVIGLMGIGFILFARADPAHGQRQAESPTLAEQLSPLVDIRVWRFSLYYFFVFGAFVALALWLPHYLMEVYGLGVATAGILAALYTIPASLFRILGGWLSDKYGARTVMYWTLIASVICTFILSYPPTEYHVRGVDGTIRFSLETSLVMFVLLTFVLGFFMSLGKAAVFKHIPVYYPGHVGVVGGVVGMVGGLGGFLLPLTFGMLNDVIGIWQSCFMLLFVVASAALIWMHFAITGAQRHEMGRGETVRDLPEMSTPDSFVLKQWDPEDKSFWESKGKAIASRNLWISIPNLFLAFAVWSIWSILVVKMPALGFSYSSNQLFWLASLPALSGATLRLFYGFMVPVFGGRRWTALSTASLLLPCIWMGFALQDTDTPYLIMLILALLCGLGGGNFSSSMANISFFYPKGEKGAALGLNAGLGNLGVSGLQLVGPLVISASVFGSLGGEPLMVTLSEGQQQPLWLQNAAFIWVPLIILASLAAWFGMHDIADAKSSFKQQAVIFRRSHTWWMCWLYLGTFGSFIGFAAGFPLLSGMLFEDVDPVKYAFIGPLAGALARPFGGVLADRLGGARVTLWNFVLMVAGVSGVIYFLPEPGQAGNFYGFFSMFLLLFISTGIGNGSTFRMVPAMFLLLRSRALGRGQEKQAEIEGNRESAAVLGFISAIAAYGGFFIPKAYGTSITLTGAVDLALYGFIGFYISCVVVTWRFYARPNAPAPC